MPVLSKFYGIVIRMYFLQREHNPPHIHAIYGDDMAAIIITDGMVLEGSLPNKALEQVREWIALNKDELLNIWGTQNFKHLPPLEQGIIMFHKIKNITSLPEYRLSVQFAVGCTKIYDMKPLFEQYPIFRTLMNPYLFSDVTVDVGGHGIVWNDELDLSCDELWENGVLVETPFDGLMAFSDATDIWSLNESTLRKAITYGKLVEGVDVCKFGKQWVVSTIAMRREYGEPKA